MAALAVLKALLGELGQRIGMADLRPDDNGIAALAVDGRFVLHIAADEDNGAVVLYALLGAVRADEQLSVCGGCSNTIPALPMAPASASMRPPAK